MMRFGLSADPAQDEVNRRHQLHFYGVGIERVFAGSERRAPDTAMARFDLLAITERLTSSVGAGHAVIRNDHADITDRDQGFGFDLDRAEPAVDKESAVCQHLQLFPAPASEFEERLRVLEVIMVALAVHDLHFRRNNFTRANGWAVLDTNDTNRVEMRIEVLHRDGERFGRSRLARAAIGKVGAEVSLAAGRSDHHRIERAHG